VTFSTAAMRRTTSGHWWSHLHCKCHWPQDKNKEIDHRTRRHIYEMAGENDTNEKVSDGALEALETFRHRRGLLPV